MTKPAWLIGNVVLGFQGLVAALDDIANTYALDAAATAKVVVSVATGLAPSPSVPATTASVTGLGNVLVALYNIVPALVSGQTGIDPSLAPGILAAGQALGSAMAAADAVTAFAAAVDTTSDAAAAATQAANRIIDAVNGEVVARLTRLVLLAPYAEALVRQTYVSRQDGITARADCVERFEREIGLCLGAVDAEVAEALTRMRDSCVEYLSRQIATLAPIVTVSAQRPLPALWWAWRLYGDPTRADDLVSRNSVPHPGFMPLQFEALSPQVRFTGQLGGA